VPARIPGSSWPSCSSVPFFVLLFATSCGGTISQSHPRMFRGRTEQQLNLASADFGPQGPVEGAATTGPIDAVGLS
jgi:hypothetical protein